MARMGIIERMAPETRALPAPVYIPDPSAVSASRLSAFMEFCEARTGESFADPKAFHEFSVGELRRFWSLFLEWSELRWEGSPDPVCTDDACERAVFFPELRMSYVENLLRVDDPADAGRPALIARAASGRTERLSREELRERVVRASAGLRELGLEAGQRVVAVSPNNADVTVAALAAMNLGATFSSAAPDMATPALLSRFEQLEPSLLFADFSSERAVDLARGLPTLTNVVALGDVAVPSEVGVPAHSLAELAARSGDASGEAGSVRFPFNHPLFVLFTSGTTGPPKCIVHGAGGTLLEHVKEHRLHVDLRPDDAMFFHTSAAWMMWNWQLSALASRSAIVTYDGPIVGPDTLWQIVSEERVTVFGTSPPYLQLCESRGFSPRRTFRLESLRAVLSTGSILHDWQYDWVRDNVGTLPLQSISGGTDIIGCFVLGNPNLPVRRGWIQCRSLGMDVDSEPSPATPSGTEIGELVCRNPFPSRPLGLLGDDGRQFHDAYFEQNPGVWTHGDLIEFDQDGQARLHGRSDGVLNVQGVRIGPAEIYRALRPVTEVREAMAVELAPTDRGERSRLVLLVVLDEGVQLDGALTTRIRREVARYASAMHVPDLVVQVRELPVTHSGKPSERAARDAVNGAPIANVDALRNPDSLDEIRTAAAAAEADERARAVDTSRAESTVDRLIPLWESVLGITPVRPDDDFFDIGGTSLAAIRLTQAIEDQLGVELPLSTLLHAPTPAAMARLIDGPADERVPLLVSLRPGTGGSPLVFVHSLSGEVLSMRHLALALATSRPIYGLQARGLDSRHEAHKRIDEMADAYVQLLRSLLPGESYALVGYSFGGLVAYEMARRLTADGEDVAWLGLIDSQLKHSCLPPRQRWQCAMSKSIQLVRSPGAVQGRLRRYLLEGVPPTASVAAGEPQLPPLIRQLEQTNLEAFDAYRPEPYEGSATFFVGDRRTPGLCSPLPVWNQVVHGGLRVERVPATHRDLIREPHVRALASAIDRDLAASLTGRGHPRGGTT